MRPLAKQELENDLASLLRSVVSQQKGVNGKEGKTVTRQLSAQLDIVLKKFIAAYDTQDEYYAKLLSIGDELFAATCYEAAASFGYRRVLFDLRQLEYSIHVREQALGEDDVDGEAAIHRDRAFLKMDQVVSQQIHARMRLAVCEFDAALKRDPSCRFGKTLQTCLHQLDELKATLLMALDRSQSLFLVVDEAAHHIYESCKRLLNLGFPSKVASYLAFAVMSYEGDLRLLDSKYLSWRVEMHGALAQIYEAMARPDDAKASAQRALDKVTEMTKMEMSDKVPPSQEVQHTLQRAKVAAQNLVLRFCPISDPPSAAPVDDKSKGAKPPAKGAPAPAAVAAPVVVAEPAPVVPWTISPIATATLEVITSSKDKISYQLQHGYTEPADRLIAAQFMLKNTQPSQLRTSQVFSDPKDVIPADQLSKRIATLHAGLESVISYLATMRQYFDSTPKSKTSPEAAEGEAVAEESVENPLTALSLPQREDKYVFACQQVPLQPLCFLTIQSFALRQISCFNFLVEICLSRIYKIMVESSAASQLDTSSVIELQGFEFQLRALRHARDISSSSSSSSAEGEQQQQQQQQHRASLLLKLCKFVQPYVQSSKDLPDRIFDPECSPLEKSPETDYWILSELMKRMLREQEAAALASGQAASLEKYLDFKGEVLSSRHGHAQAIVDVINRRHGLSLPPLAFWDAEKDFRDPDLLTKKFKPVKPYPYYRDGIKYVSRRESLVVQKALEATIRSDSDGARRRRAALQSDLMHALERRKLGLVPEEQVSAKEIFPYELTELPIHNLRSCITNARPFSTEFALWITAQVDRTSNSSQLEDEVLLCGFDLLHAVRFDEVDMQSLFSLGQAVAESLTEIQHFDKSISVWRRVISCIDSQRSRLLLFDPMNQAALSAMTVDDLLSAEGVEESEAAQLARENAQNLNSLHAIAYKNLFHTELLFGQFIARKAAEREHAKSQADVLARIEKQHIYGTLSDHAAALVAEKAHNLELKVPESYARVEQRLLEEVGENMYLRGLLLSEMASFHTEVPERQQRLFLEATKALSFAASQEKEVLARNVLGSTSKVVCRSRTATSLTLSVTHNFEQLKHQETPESVIVYPRYVVLFGKSAAIGKTVTINDFDLTGTGDRHDLLLSASSTSLPVDQQKLEPSTSFVVDNLEPNHIYIFAVQYLDEAGTPMCPVGRQTDELCTCFPLNLPLLWSFVAQNAFRLNCLNSFRICADQVYQHFVNAGTNPDIEVRDLLTYDSLRSERVLSAPKQLLVAFTNVLFDLADMKQFETRRLLNSVDQVSSSSGKAESATASNAAQYSEMKLGEDMQLLRNVNKLMMALELANVAELFDLQVRACNRALYTMNWLLSGQQKPSYLLNPLLSILDTLADAIVTVTTKTQPLTGFSDEEPSSCGHSASDWIRNLKTKLVDFESRAAPKLLRRVTLAYAIALKSSHHIVSVGMHLQEINVIKYAAERFVVLLKHRSTMSKDLLDENRMVADGFHDLLRLFYSSSECAAVLSKASSASSPSSPIVDDVFSQVYPAIMTDPDKGFADLLAKFSNSDLFAQAGAFAIEMMLMKDRPVDAIASVVSQYTSVLDDRLRIRPPTYEKIPPLSQPANGDASKLNPEEVAKRREAAVLILQQWCRFVLTKRRLRAKAAADQKHRAFVAASLSSAKFESLLSLKGLLTRMVKPSPSSSAGGFNVPSVQAINMNRLREVPSYIMPKTCDEILDMCFKQTKPTLPEERKARLAADIEQKKKAAEEAAAASAAAAAAASAPPAKGKPAPVPAKGGAAAPAEAAAPVMDDTSIVERIENAFVDLVSSIARSAELSRRAGLDRQLYNTLLQGQDMIYTAFVSTLPELSYTPPNANDAQAAAAAAADGVAPPVVPHLPELSSSLVDIVRRRVNRIAARVFPQIKVLQDSVVELLDRAIVRTNESEERSLKDRKRTLSTIKNEEMTPTMRLLVTSRATTKVPGSPPRGSSPTRPATGSPSRAGLATASSVRSSHHHHPRPTLMMEEPIEDLVMPAHDSFVHYADLDRNALARLCHFFMRIYVAEGTYDRLYSFGMLFSELTNSVYNEPTFKIMAIAQVQMQRHQQKMEHNNDAMRSVPQTPMGGVSFSNGPPSRAGRNNMASRATSRLSFGTGTVASSVSHSMKAQDPDFLVDTGDYKAMHARASKEKPKTIRQLEAARALLAKYHAERLQSGSITSGGLNNGPNSARAESAASSRSAIHTARSSSRFGGRSNGSEAGAPVDPVSNMVQHYERAVDTLRAKNETDMLLEALNELGDLYASQGFVGKAIATYSAGIDAIFLRVNCLVGWEDMLDQEYESGATLLNKIGGVHRCLAAASFAGKCARVASEERTVTSLCLFAAECIFGLFRGSAVHPQNKYEYATYVPAEIYPNVMLFANAFQCDVNALLDALQLCSDRLLSNNFGLHALPMLSMAEHIASFYCRDPRHLILARCTKAKALSQVGLFRAASQYVTMLFTGRGLPRVVSPYSTLHNSNFVHWQPVPPTAEEAAAAALKGSAPSDIESESMLFFEQLSLDNAANQRWIDATAERRLTAAVAQLMGDSLAIQSLLAKSTLLISIAATQPLGCLSVGNDASSGTPAAAAAAAAAPKTPAAAPPKGGAAPPAAPASSSAVAGDSPAAKASTTAYLAIQSACARLLAAAESHLRALQGQVISDATQNPLPPSSSASSSFGASALGPSPSAPSSVEAVTADKIPLSRVTFDALCASNFLLAQVEALRGRTEVALQCLSRTVHFYRTSQDRIVDVSLLNIGTFSSFRCPSLSVAFPLECRILQSKLLLQQRMYSACRTLCQKSSHECLEVKDELHRRQLRLVEAACDILEGHLSQGAHKLHEIFTRAQRQHWGDDFFPSLLLQLSSLLDSHIPLMVQQQKRIDELYRMQLAQEKADRASMYAAPSESKKPSLIGKPRPDYADLIGPNVFQSLQPVLAAVHSISVINGDPAVADDADDLETSASLEKHIATVARFSAHSVGMLRSHVKRNGLESRQQLPLLYRLYAPGLTLLQRSYLSAAIAESKCGLLDESLHSLNAIINLQRQNGFNNSTCLSEAYLNMGRILARKALSSDNDGYLLDSITWKADAVSIASAPPSAVEASSSSSIGEAALSALAQAMELTISCDASTVHNLELIRTALLESSIVLGSNNDARGAAVLLAHAARVAEVQRCWRKGLNALCRKAGVALKSADELPSFVLSERLIASSMTKAPSVALENIGQQQPQQPPVAASASAAPAGKTAKGSEAPVAPAPPSSSSSSSASSLLQHVALSHRYPSPLPSTASEDAAAVVSPLTVLMAYSTLTADLSCALASFDHSRASLLESRIIRLHQYLKQNLVPQYMDELCFLRVPSRHDTIATASGAGYICTQMLKMDAVTPRRDSDAQEATVALLLSLGNTGEQQGTVRLWSRILKCRHVTRVQDTLRSLRSLIQRRELLSNMSNAIMPGAADAGGSAAAAGGKPAKGAAPAVAPSKPAVPMRPEAEVQAEQQHIDSLKQTLVRLMHALLTGSDIEMEEMQQEPLASSADAAPKALSLSLEQLDALDSLFDLQGGVSVVSEELCAWLQSATVSSS